MSAAALAFAPDPALVQDTARTLRPCGTDAAYSRHRRHGETACSPCLKAHRAATARYYRDRRTGNPRGRSRARRDHVLEEWEFFDGPTGGIGFEAFAERVGMTLAAWERCYYRARNAGDARATGRRNLRVVR